MQILEMFVCLMLFYVPLKNISLIWRCHHMPVKGFKFWPILGTYGHWAVRDLLRANIYCNTGPRVLLSHPKDRKPTSADDLMPSVNIYTQITIVRNAFEKSQLWSIWYWQCVNHDHIFIVNYTEFFLFIWQLLIYYVPEI